MRNEVKPEYGGEAGRVGMAGHGGEMQDYDILNYYCTLK